MLSGECRLKPPSEPVAGGGEPRSMPPWRGSTARPRSSRPATPPAGPVGAARANLRRRSDRIFPRALVVSRRKAYSRASGDAGPARAMGLSHPRRRSLMIGNRPPVPHPDPPPTAAETRSRPGCLFVSHRGGTKPCQPSNRMSDRPAVMAFRPGIDAVVRGRRN